MNVTINQQNNNYGSGTQYNIQNSIQSNYNKETINQILKTLKENKEGLPDQLVEDVNDLIEIVENSSEDEFKKPSFVSRFYEKCTKITLVLSTAVVATENIEKIINAVGKLKQLFDGFLQ